MITVTSTVTSLLWELFVAGLLLYGLAFLGMALWMREPKTLVGALNERRLAPAGHSRLTAPQPSRMRSMPNTRSRPTARRSAGDAVRSTRRVATRTRR